MSRPLLPIILVFLMAAACGESRHQGPIASREVDTVRGWLDGNNAQDETPIELAASQPVAPVGQMIDGLARRLEEQPDDVDGWRLLAQSYAYVGDMDRARFAADKAVSLGADEAAVSTAILDAHTDRSR